MQNWVIIDYIWVLVDSDAPLNIEHIPICGQFIKCARITKKNSHRFL